MPLSLLMMSTAPIGIAVKRTLSAIFIFLPFFVKAIIVFRYLSVSETSTNASFFVKAK